MNNTIHNQIRAVFDENTIRVYQAYNHSIADAALAAGTFVSPPFSVSRMTWIKPSFLWMMYRAGWGHKDEGQSRILAIDITRAGFEWALDHSCLSHPPPDMSKNDWAEMKAASPVRVQWDPERDIHLHALPYRAIQIGLSENAVRLYTDQWIQGITDITDYCHEICSLVEGGRVDQAKSMLPLESTYISSRPVKWPSM